MPRPYASVILPTLNRSSTLPWSLASVQRQTESSLEILVVLDGATAACREIANSVARDDGRIRVFDLPKAPDAGASNVDVAVARTCSDRIFYIDDDDLWFADHVARLGPLLDHADIADSRVGSVDRGGVLNLGPCRGSNDRMRELLGSHRLKLLYDTHIAHRRDAYGRLSQWGIAGGSGVPVTDFLAGFAAHPGCRWASCDAVTALSIHGAARRDMEDAARTAEIMAWSSKLGDRSALMLGAHATFHLFRLLISDPPRDETLGEYLAARGGYPAGPIGRPDEDLFALFARQAIPEPRAASLATRLLEPVEAGSLLENVAAIYFDVYGQDAHERILRDVAAGDGRNLASRLAAYSAAVSRRDIDLALDLAERAVAVGPDSIGGLSRWRDRLASRRS